VAGVGAGEQLDSRLCWKCRLRESRAGHDPRGRDQVGLLGGCPRQGDAEVGPLAQCRGVTLDRQAVDPLAQHDDAPTGLP
jgi:hypothetical protein